MSIVIGIDPGASGAMVRRAIAYDDGHELIDSIKLCETERDIYEWLVCYADRAHITRAYIERVHSMPKQGVASSFKFGQNYGFLRGILIASRIPFEEVTPQKWQKALGCMSKGNKNVTKAKAQQIFPTIKMTHAVADAYLISEYGRRLNPFNPSALGSSPAASK